MTKKPSRESILVVNDSEVIGQIISDKCREFFPDTDVSACMSGEEAIKKVAGDDFPDLVLLDILMPGMDGVEALKKIKEIRSEIKVVMLTVIDEKDPRFDETFTNCFDSGAIDYIGLSEGGEANPTIFRNRIQNTLNLIRREKECSHSAKLSAIGTMAGSIAHNLNNILTGIMGLASLPDHHDNPQMNEIVALTHQASGVVAQLLQFVRKTPYNPELVYISASAIENFKTLVNFIVGKVEVNFVVPDGLHCIKVDRGQMEEALMNLITNARDAVEEFDENGITVRFENVDLDEENASGLELKTGPHVKISVSDKGSGMDAETQGRMFERFFTTKQENKGTGLGLSSVDDFVKRSEGSIRVQSEEGEGTTFELFFPSAKERN